MRYLWTKIKNIFVAKETGKGLSTNDFTAAYKSKLDGIANNANNYSLPTASSTTLGGIKVGSGLSISGGTLSVSGGSGISLITEGSVSLRGNTKTVTLTKEALVVMVTTSGGTMSGNAQGLVLKGTTFHISETYGSNPFNLQVSLSSNGKTIIFDTSYSYTFSVSYLAIE